MEVQLREHTRPSKIRKIEDLASELSLLKGSGKKIVNCHGVFDLLHIGHIRHLAAAKKLGDVLVVTITPDQYVNKGPHRPAFPQDLRAEALAALDDVDFVAVNQWPTAIEGIKLLKPDFYVKGAEYRDASRDHTGNIRLEEEAITEVGGRIVYTEDITFSSTSLINKHLSVFPEEVERFLQSFRNKFERSDIFRYLDQARTMRVLVIGETIIDEYQYCQTMGKSGKEPILAARHLSGERFAGGILAVANNVASFSDHVGVASCLGTVDSHEDFIRNQLNPKIKPYFHYLPNAPTIVKRRFVEMYPFQKLFEIYIMNGNENHSRQSEEFANHVEQLLPEFDLVIVTDYGHGMLGPEAVEILCAKSRFLAINTQVNADNRGFNTVSKYPRADFICVSENEIRLEARSRVRDLQDILLEISNRLHCSRILITSGERGCVCYSEKEGFSEIPAFTGHVIDRVGAGDTVFAATSLCVAQDAPMEIVGMIGNAVGAQAVATVGNRESINRGSFFKYLESLLK